VSNFEQPNIAIISAIVFLCTSKILGSSNFELCLYSLDIQTSFAKLTEASNLFNVPSEYYKFANVFSKTKAETLAPHCPYDLQINLKEGTQPPVCQS